MQPLAGCTIMGGEAARPGRALTTPPHSRAGRSSPAREAGRSLGLDSPARICQRSRAGAASTKAPGAGGQNKRPEGPRRPPGRRPPAPKPRSGRRRGDPAGPREAQRGGRNAARATAAKRRKPAAKGGRPQAQRGQREPAEARSAAQGPSERAGGKRRGPAPATERSEGGRKRRTGAAKRGPGGPRRSGRAQGQGPRRKSGRGVRKKRRGPRPQARQRGTSGPEAGPHTAEGVGAQRPPGTGGPAAFCRGAGTRPRSGASAPCRPGRADNSPPIRRRVAPAGATTSPGLGAASFT